MTHDYCNANDLATFVMIYQERVGFHIGAISEMTNTTAREQTDPVGSQTRTDARETVDTDVTMFHGAFPLDAATKTLTETRESADSDAWSASAVFETMTKTGTREQDDTDINAAYLSVRQ